MGGCDPIQWNLRITDTFGTHCFLTILSFIERSEVKSTRTLGKSPFGWYIETCPLFGDYFYCVPYSECPLSEVPL